MWAGSLRFWCVPGGGGAGGGFDVGNEGAFKVRDEGGEVVDDFLPPRGVANGVLARGM